MGQFMPEMRVELAEDVRELGVRTAAKGDRGTIQAILGGHLQVRMDDGRLIWCSQLDVVVEKQVHGPMTFQRWLDDQRNLQVTAYHESPGDKDGEDFAASAMMNHSALVIELGEMMQELAWKPWSSTRGRADSHLQAAKRELVDCMHFMANLWLLVGMDADEFARMWRAKQQINAERQARAYNATAVGEKVNGRATDDVG